eukprot:jgi/Chrzof1/5046/Cz15g09220.t1
MPGLQIDAILAQIQQQLQQLTQQGSQTNQQVVQTNQQVVQTNQQIAQNQQQTQQQMVQNQQQIQQQLDQMLVQIAVGNNNAARALNALAKDTTRLTPLVDDTGQEVAGFPETPSAFRRLHVGQVNGLLSSYGLEMDGDRFDKQDRLLAHWGYQ